ncbi:hypothetical protein [Nocardioides sp. SYSU DS0651]|uniref:hypothetical protein n=1 Tax=Nocardioides sp. SYSU DS0651 TaxID=3415955 RepID=UPI003F4C4728
MKSARRLVVAIGTATAVCLLVAPAVSGPASAGPGLQAKPDPTPAPAAEGAGKQNVTVTDDGWIHYRTDLSALGPKAQRKLVKGTPGRGGTCTLSGVERGNAGSKVVVREEVAFNPATCETEYLVAELTPAEAAAYADTADVTEEPVVRAQTDVTAAAATTYNRWVRTAWVDPIEIDISSTKVALQWNRNQWLKRGVARNSFKGCISGQCLDETYIVSKANYYGNYSNRFEFSGVTHFRNTAFAKWVVFFFGAGGWAACGFPTSSTANFHHDEQVIGFKSGAWEVRWDDRKNGACTNLVHHESSNGGSWPFG